MDAPSHRENVYVLGNDPEELARLDRQAQMIARPTRMLLQAAGIGEGQRVVDLGTGLGHVARMLAELVGPAGTVIGVDRSAQALAVARQRALAAADDRVSYYEGDVTRWTADRPVDAMVARLLLFHLPAPADAVRQHRENLRAGGVFVAIDYDIGTARTEPPVPFVDEVRGWIMQAFSGAGAHPRIGARLGTILSDAGLQDVNTFGIQAYLAPRDPAAGAFLGGVVRSLSSVILERGIASREQLGLDTLDQRIADELRRADAVLLPPAVVGAWGRHVLA